MDNAYASPQATLKTEEQVELTFSSLGIWRKLFLGFNFLTAFVMVFALILALIVGETESGTELGGFTIFVFCVVFIGYYYWVHVAVSQRNITQLTILVIIQIIPLFNPIGALIMFAIRVSSKKELNLA